MNYTRGSKSYNGETPWRGMSGTVPVAQDVLKSDAELEVPEDVFFGAWTGRAKFFHTGAGHVFVPWLMRYRGPIHIFACTAQADHGY